MQRLATFATTHPRLLTAVFAALTLVAVFGVFRVGMDASVSAMYPDQSEYADVQDQVEATFGAGQMLVVLLEGDVLEPVAFEALRELTNSLAKVPGVTSTTSVANAQRMEDDDGFLLIEDLVPASGPITVEDVGAARDYLATSRLFQGGVLLAEDGTSANIMLEADLDADSGELVAAAEAAIDAAWTSQGFGAAHLVGGPVVDTATRQMLQRDTPLLGTIAALLLVVMLFLNFRTAAGALLPLLTVIIGLAWAFGTMGWLGGSFNTLIAIAPVAILAVGSSFSLHLLGRYSVELAHGREKVTAVRTAVTETGLGVLISGLAIAAAMLTFTLSGMPAVRTLGLLVSGGVLASLLTSLLLLPAILTLMPRPKRVIDAEAPGAIAGVLRWLGGFVAKRRWVILGCAAVLAIVSGFGVTRIEPNTAVLDYFRADSSIRLDYDKVEGALGGSSQVQVLVIGDLGDPATLQALSDFQERVDDLPGTGPSNSIATVISAIHETLTGEFAVPTTREGVAQELLLYQLSGDPQQISKYVTLDSTMGLVDLSIATGSTKEQRELVDQIDAIAQETLAGHVEHAFAGSTMMQLAIEDALLHDFLLSLSLAVLLVIIIDSLVRSIPAALVTIVVLLLTILVQYGMLGYLGVPLDLATMLLGALAIGVGDYAIHLTVRYMEQLRAGDAPEAAMATAILTSGRSILFTALTLGAGFGALIFSQFVPIRTLGSLMAFTVMSVGIISLLVLPAACLVFLRKVRGVPSTRPEEVVHV